MDLTILRNHQLQEAVRLNLVSFPSQAPVYRRQPRADIQWRLAVLYFVRGWSLADVANRYRMSRERAGQIIKAWRILCVEGGYIQEIPPGASPDSEAAAARTPAFPPFIPTESTAGPAGGLHSV
jgi:hypothetical protein